MLTIKKTAQAKILIFFYYKNNMKITYKREM